MDKKVFISEGLGLELIQYSGSDEMVADAARVSTDRDRQGKQIEGLIKYLAKEGHLSPFEHCHATFMVTAPLFVRDQWVRHRTQSYNALSLRYVEMDLGSESIQKGFYFPPDIRPLKNEGSSAHPILVEKPNRLLHESVVDTLKESYLNSYTAYKSLLYQGVASEIARSVLPEATVTRFYATANMRNWNAFVNERTAPNAQWEIKQLALHLSAMMHELYPISWKALRESTK